MAPPLVPAPDFGNYSIQNGIRVAMLSAKRPAVDPPTDPNAKRAASIQGAFCPSEDTDMADAGPAAPITVAPSPSHVPPPPPPPPVGSIGIMDVGQGNCNLIFDNANPPEPIAYYDVGFPIFFYKSGAPANLVALGPILQNQTNNLEVILSHWDYDHWINGRRAGLQNLVWNYPKQLMGPVAINFLGTIAVRRRVTFPITHPWWGGARLVKCSPAGMPLASWINNSGLALMVDILLPVNDPNWHSVFLTADANHNTAPLLPFGCTGITAVHHGSGAHGAAQNLVPPANLGAAGPGRIAYSYGVSPNNGSHPYHFPVQASVTAYRNAGWGAFAGGAGPVLNAELACAETPLNYHQNMPQPPRGNIRMGDNTQLNNAHYGNTAFYNYRPMI
ncbi:hypothetical protein [Leptospira ilyithenensis]|uniref:Uncharacterized protein n=1 Tax=Leptospira ilyithenensis TaxID=2484901 RepID=A0A4R9LTS2_9LEPT|nr:hypothetical protein [Leptospira ilyithenensis]TGN14063.1 hypothetical protein EHS11_02800 [Leptospira ilyithenensis]